MQPDLRLGTSAATVANRVGSTAVLEYRPAETIPPFGAMLPSPARLCRPRSPQTARTRGNRGLFHERRRNPPRHGLSAGGNWIRNFSSALSLVVSRASDIRDPGRAAGRIGGRFASQQEGTDSASG